MADDRMLEALDRIVAAILVLAIMVSINEEQSLSAGVERVAEAYETMVGKVVR